MVEFYADPDDSHRCTVCCKEFRRRQDLKAHRTRMRHKECKDEMVTGTAKTDTKLAKRKEMQRELSTVKWGEEITANC